MLPRASPAVRSPLNAVDYVGQAGPTSGIGPYAGVPGAVALFHGVDLSSISQILKEIPSPADGWIGKDGSVCWSGP